MFSWLKAIILYVMGYFVIQHTIYNLSLSNFFKVKINFLFPMSNEEITRQIIGALKSRDVLTLERPLSVRKSHLQTLLVCECLQVTF